MREFNLVFLSSCGTSNTGTDKTATEQNTPEQVEAMQQEADKIVEQQLTVVVDWPSTLKN